MEARASSNGRHFMAGLWLLLATVVLSALAPAALVQSTIHGSAFSPATVQVAIKATARPPRLTVQRLEPDSVPLPQAVHAARPPQPTRQSSRAEAPRAARAAPPLADQYARARPWPTGPPSA